ncbi:hypothetical protein ECEC1865_5992, partial [Escherichia coli EC1865]
AGGDQQP